LLEYLDRKTKQLQQGNVAAQWLLCCVKCCMWCLEKIMAFINRNAYILMAIKGTGYCSSAARALKLIVTVRSCNTCSAKAMFDALQQVVGLIIVL
jgi:choline transporter-like protein 2/4/5